MVFPQCFINSSAESARFTRACFICELPIHREAFLFGDRDFFIELQRVDQVRCKSKQTPDKIPLICEVFVLRLKGRVGSNIPGDVIEESMSTTNVFVALL